MRQFSMETSKRTAGLDISDRYSQVYVVDPNGTFVEEYRMRTTSPALQRCFG